MTLYTHSQLLVKTGLPQQAALDIFIDRYVQETLTDGTDEPVLFDRWARQENDGLSDQLNQLALVAAYQAYRRSDQVVQRGVQASFQLEVPLTWLFAKYLKSLLNQNPERRVTLMHLSTAGLPEAWQRWQATASRETTFFESTQFWAGCPWINVRGTQASLLEQFAIALEQAIRRLLDQQPTDDRLLTDVTLASAQNQVGTDQILLTSAYPTPTGTSKTITHPVVLTLDDLLNNSNRKNWSKSTGTTQPNRKWEK